MTTTLRVIVDEMLAPSSGTSRRFAEELTRELIRTAPPDCEVSAIVASSSESDYDRIRELLPGLSAVFKSALAHRELQLAWQHGITRLPGSGMVHAPSLLAPLFRHDRLHNPTNQIVVSVTDAAAWTHPQLVSPRHAAWSKAMLKRAHRYADAIVTPTHAVAHAISEVLDFGDRVRVISGAPSGRVTVPVDSSRRADRLELPDRYIFAAGTQNARSGLDALVRSLGSDGDAGLPLLISGPSGWEAPDLGAEATSVGVDPDRVRSLGELDDADFSAVLSGAAVFVAPQQVDGAGLGMLEAFALSTPVVHSDAPALVEVSAGAGLLVETLEAGSYPERLAETLTSVVEDDALAARLRYAGVDRAAAFSWRDSAQRVWQLHADL